ncbi:MAG: hypothetical protein FWC19_00540, partial [Treponema sp.]|nr:hypothetical protein [Treponema sp.]MCL2271278.1 hypothetical protein [Treponema sp.]
MEYTCKICWNSENNSLYTVKEIIIGNGDEFEYIECSRCGCLQIAEIPKNLARYYEGYYSLGAVDDKNITRIQKFISDSFEKSKIYYYTKKGGIIARSICWFFPELMPPPPP